MAGSPYSTHKPRRKQKAQENHVLTPMKHSSSTLYASKWSRPPFPLAQYLWVARGGSSQTFTLSIILGVVFLYRWAVGFWDYSGFQAPPMHGDFEAQRHWLEITLHLPVSEWYFHDLGWWGLDYPPLTAYHSWLLGNIGAWFDPAWFALRASRALDDPDLKVYMRATVVASEYLTYIPAIVLFLRRFAKSERTPKWESSVALAAILMQPGTILIDHAHFQYNTVMLGFMAASLAAVFSGSYARACAYFVAALGFKQMALYYAPAVFAFLLGSCLYPSLSVGRFLGISFTTFVSFGLLLTPIVVGTAYDVYFRGVDLNYLPPPDLLKALPVTTETPGYPIMLQLAQMIHRIFPFARGLFEDKVANFWCALHTFHKLHRYPKALLQRASLGLTLFSIFPCCLAILLRPQPRLFPLALATCAWGFFLFSFQVHEKSVLLPLLPMTLLFGSDEGLQPEMRSWITWANVLGSWTMYPLLKRDGLRTPYFALTLFWAYMMGVHSLLFPSKQDSSRAHVLSRLIHGAFYLAMITWHFVEAFVPPVAGKPDIWVVVNVLIGAAGFGICYIWCLWRLIAAIYGDVVDYGRRKGQEKEKPL